LLTFPVVSMFQQLFLQIKQAASVILLLAIYSHSGSILISH